MNKTELVAVAAEKTALTKKDAEAVITAALDAIAEALRGGDDVRLVGFGTFGVRERAERTGIEGCRRKVRGDFWCAAVHR